ncbi:unnamed protein product [Effrenium voratum]|uniref:Protein kinase domain-containing protein n=1 Tax=Effrenium voratum TaxID=2562239 RepID=A0AA36IFR9_9DINO|nr:unnamed protein product [Effrenium voratum]CAJ1419806.1 unnamed protein product [Effrenium voratum]|mmetsp:Transcript_119598/g.284065  ORF Transcript_119598/g.284065 Transcript_119598/m.284065 type:complete len:443 (-) Transcript_119598:198-1526(-)|eukprot:CAMPEP_0181454882 /NCGR_PEP_ID=MMETSP1110-20121109/30469_1 /TAXON_ID=174948 /ORGANISM="Symbiodinium sp., Strain CCMP421" /LENGTH=442 /DNA_ID=CAMNT_0023579245 /DNA_START=30 /DNA_END=1358 /DNA_ORIENTATION=+
MSGKERAGGAELPSYLKIVKQLGRGAYGTVYLCEDKKSGEQVAVKHVKQAARHGKSMLREIRLLARLRHENLLYLLDFPAVSSPDYDDIYLVLPYLAADLHKIIQSQQALSEKHVQVILVQILRAMEYLHASGVAHRDLKPANILLSSDCKLKVCDFGLARGGLGLDGDEPEEACGTLTEYVVTRWYRAPEVMLLPKQYSTAVDIWSVGCILGEILGRKAMFPGKNHIDMVTMVAKFVGNPSDEQLGWLPKETDAYRFLRKVCPQGSGVNLASTYPNASPACLSLLKALLCWDPRERLTAAQAQKHEYVKHYYPREPPTPPEPFDWTFDGFKATAKNVQVKLYEECARYHPEILARDGAPASAAGGYAAAPQARQDVSPRHSRRDATPTRSSTRSITPVRGAMNGLARAAAAMRMRSTTPPPAAGTTPRRSSTSSGQPIRAI